MRRFEPDHPIGSEPMNGYEHLTDVMPPEPDWVNQAQPCRHAFKWLDPKPVVERRPPAPRYNRGFPAEWTWWPKGSHPGQPHS